MDQDHKAVSNSEMTAKLIAILNDRKRVSELNDMELVLEAAAKTNLMDNFYAQEMAKRLHPDWVQDLMRRN